MITNKDIDESLVMAEVLTNQMIAKAVREFYRPDIEMETAVLWSGLDPRIQEAVRRKAPGAVKRIEEQIKGRRGG